ncbi:SDR family oxidoreductase [Herbidospora sp. NBRC 101105]|uniref:SDR family NAD(P)-dependent oxidoreductase n=1 Tax=Herbidospora sp. NBRC 101105 TaxID=3032195 RepID=UPI0024A56A98|nr:SDR family oxidoreductase [Herbidospora sp. NBRC 101105]GLX95183.1 dehydrogenase [Herbidospora sp. NBRC 101105]
MRLSGKIALVTGGTSGIGEGIARRFGAEGATVVLTGRRADLGERIAAEIGAATFVPGDLTSAETRAALVAAVEAQGGLDVLVNNAAAFGDTVTDQVTDDDFDRIVGLNFRAAFLVTRDVVPYLIRKPGGRIVNISSIGVTRAWPGASVYNASKAALENLTQTWAHEYGPYGLTANALTLPIVDAPMSLAAREHVDLEAIPSRRIGTVEDVADMAVFLAGDESGYLNGARIPLDGGQTA